MFAKWFQKLGFIACLTLLSSAVWAETYPDDYIGEDTILVEKEVSQKVPYHKIARSLFKHFFKVDTRSLLTFGEGRTGNVIRSFSELGERTKYRVKVKQDEIELKLSLSF